MDIRNGKVVMTAVEVQPLLTQIARIEGMIKDFKDKMTIENKEWNMDKIRGYKVMVKEMRETLADIYIVVV